MKKFIGQVKAGDVVVVRIIGEKEKACHTVKHIKFGNAGSEFEYAVLTLDNDQEQTWYTTETIEIVK